MTQALLNNLNINQENSFIQSKNITTDKTNAANFDKIFEKQTNLVHKDDHTKVNQVITKENTTNSTNNSNKNEKIELLNSNINLTKDSNNIEKSDNSLQTIGEMKEVSKETLSTDFKNILKEVTKEVVEENAVGIGLIKDVEEILEKINPDIETQAENEPIELEDTNNESDNTQVSTECIVTETIPVDEKLQSHDIILTQQQLTTPNELNNKKIEVIDSNDQTCIENDLKVTLNGQDIESFFEDFGLSNQVEELTLVKPEQTEVNKNIELEDMLDEEAIKELNIESIKTETSAENNSSTDLMQQQTPEEHSVKVMIQTDVEFNDFKVEDVKTTNQTTTTKPSVETSPSKIIEQVTKQLENFNGTSKVNIVLNPEALGKVSLHIVNTKEGLMAQFTVATQEAKELLMKGIDGLKDSLISQGVSIDNVSVKLNESQESEYQSDWTEQEGSRGGNKEQSKKQNQEDTRKFEQMMFGFENEENGNV